MVHSYANIHYLKHLFAESQLSKLYWTYSLSSAATALVSILGPIYLFRIGYSIQSIIVFFFMTAAFKVAALPFVFMVMSKHGANKTMAIGLICMIIMLLCFSTLEQYAWPLIILAFFKALANAFYYSSFRVSFALLCNKGIAGTQASRLNTLVLILGSTTPFIGGVIATVWSIPAVYLLSVLFFSFSLVIMLSGLRLDMPNFSLHKIPRKTAVRDYLSNASYSTSGLADLLVWPLFISFIIPSYAGIGAFSTFLILISATIQLWSGKMGDIKGEKKFATFGTAVGIAYSFFRVLATSVFHLVGLSFLHAVSGALLSSSYDSRYYKNVDPNSRMEYLFAMELANSVPWLLYFPLLLAASNLLNIENTLIFGIIIIAPAILGVMLIRFDVTDKKLFAVA